MRMYADTSYYVELRRAVEAVGDIDPPSYGCEYNTD